MKIDANNEQMIIVQMTDASGMCTLVITSNLKLLSDWTKDDPDCEVKEINTATMAHPAVRDEFVRMQALLNCDVFVDRVAQDFPLEGLTNGDPILEWINENFEELKIGEPIVLIDDDHPRETVEGDEQEGDDKAPTVLDDPDFNWRHYAEAIIRGRRNFDSEDNQYSTTIMFVPSGANPLVQLVGYVSNNTPELVHVVLEEVFDSLDNYISPMTIAGFEEEEDSNFNEIIFTLRMKHDGSKFQINFVRPTKRK